MQTTRELRSGVPDSAGGDSDATRPSGTKIEAEPSEARSDESGAFFARASWVAAAAAVLGGVGLLNAGQGPAAGLAFAGSLYLAAVAMGYRSRTYRSVEWLRVSATCRGAGLDA